MSSIPKIHHAHFCTRVHTISCGMGELHIRTSDPKQGRRVGADRVLGESLCCVSHVPEEAPLLQKPEAGCVGVEVGGTELVGLGPGLLLSSESPWCVRARGAWIGLPLLGTEPRSSSRLSWTPGDEACVLGSARSPPLAALWWTSHRDPAFRPWMAAPICKARGWAL